MRLSVVRSPGLAWLTRSLVLLSAWDNSIIKDTAAPAVVVFMNVLRDKSCLDIMFENMGRVTRHSPDVIFAEHSLTSVP